MDFKHVSVLRDEPTEALDPKPDGSYIDGTAGGGGHSAKILERLSGRGKLLMIDRDPDAIAVLQSRFSSDERAKIAAGNFSQMQSIAEENGIVLLATDKRMYEACGTLYLNGLGGALHE